jgi:hypothetical protein
MTALEEHLCDRTEPARGAGDEDVQRHLVDLLAERDTPVGYLGSPVLATITTVF